MMKKIKIEIVLLMALLGLCLGLNPAEAKEKPPPELYRIFNSFNDLETKIRKERWEESMIALVKIDSEFQKILGLLESQTGLLINKKFHLTQDRLLAFLVKKDAEGSDEPYMQMQKIFLDIMSRYDYPLSPALMVATRYVKEAKAGLKRGDLQEVVEEMEEIIGLKGCILDSLREKGADDPEGFFEKVEAVASSAAGGKKDVAEKGLGELEAYLAP